MATYSVNQIKIPVVAKAAVASDSTTPGNVKEVALVDNELHLMYVNAIGQLVHSDAIPLDKINYKSVKGYQAPVYRVDKLTINDLVVGGSYVLRFIFSQWGSGSQENQYTMAVGPVIYKQGQTAEDIVDKFIELGNDTFNSGEDKYLAFTKEGTGANAKLVITEIPQEWVLGKKEQRLLQYDIFTSSINVNGVETALWGTWETTPGKPGNGDGEQAADMEYFGHGFIGDIYRGTGFPYNWNTKYLLDSSKMYDTIDIGFYFQGAGTYVAHSDKQLVILCEKTSAEDHTVANAIIDMFNAKAPGFLTKFTAGA